jgi:hypothetical protein
VTYTPSGSSGSYATIPASVALNAMDNLSVAPGGDIDLIAGPATATQPDGTTVPMWGYRCGPNVSTVSCRPLSGTTDVAQGALGGIYVLDGGSGYSSTSAPAVSISGGGGSNAQATAIVNGGQVVGFNFTNRGSGYTSAPTVTIAAPGSGRQATAATAPAWSPVLITVPWKPGGASLSIELTNNLSFGTAAGQNIPTSIVITGQVGGGLGTVPVLGGGAGAPTATASPDHSNAQGCVSWFIAGLPPGVPCASNQSGALPPAQMQGRVQSMAAEVAAVAPGTGSPTTLTWSALKPGTYLLESGTHPSIQVPMGLIGVLVVTAAPSGSGTNYSTGTAYPSPTATTAASQVAVPAVQYDAEVPVEFSEIDPVQNKQVDLAVRTPGFSETTVWSGATGDVVDLLTVTNPGSGYTTPPTVSFSGGGGNGAAATAVIDTTAGSPTIGQVLAINVSNGGAGYTSAPNVMLTGGGATVGAVATAQVASSGCALSHTCYPPAVNYTPFYFLINGQAFDKTNPGRSLFAALPTGAPATGTVLVRMVNAGLRMHVPSIVGSQTQGFTGAGAPGAVGGFTLIAEDGNPVPDSNGTAVAPRVKTEVFMAAGKTYDVMVNVPTCTPVAPATTCSPSSLPIFDREMSLSANSSVRDAGMLAYIGVNGSSLPNINAGGFGGGGQANPDTYPSVVPCATNATCIPFNITDPSKGVIANDINVYGVRLSAAPQNGTLTCNAQPGNPVPGICANGTFTYTPMAGATATTGQPFDTFNYCANGAAPGVPGLCTTVTLNVSTLLAGNPPVAKNITYTSKIATYLKISSPGVLSVDSDPNGLALQVVTGTIAQPTGQTGVTINMDPQGGFTATAPGAGTYTFTYKAQNSVGTQTAAATVTLIFPQPSNLKVNVLDAQAYSNCNGDQACIGKLVPFPDYRWIIEEDKTFFVDPNCTANNSSTTTGCPSVVGPAGQTTIPTSGVQFHTSSMDYVAQGCTGPISCEGGQTMLDSNPSSGTFGQHVPAVCDLGNGACRPDPTGGQGSTPVDPKQVHLDPTKRYYISVLPGDAANPFPANASPAACNGQEAASIAADPNQAQCGHTMTGAPITAACNVLVAGCTSTSNVAFAPVNVLALPTPLPTGKLSVLVFEDDYPLNGEQDGGGGAGGAIAPVEPGLGGFNIVLWDTFGGLGDFTGQNSNDMFNQPLSNSLAGTIDPTTGLDACPVSANPLQATGNDPITGAPALLTGNGAGPNPATGMTGMIVTCPKYEADGTTLSPLAGQAVIANLMPEKFSVQAYPGADRIARGEEWIQTNTLDGQHPHDAFIEIGDPSYFQEYGPAGYHVMIGFANPKIINARHDDVCKGFGTPGTVGPCTNTVKGQVDVERLSRIPDERLYSSESRDALTWTQCWVSLGDPDGEDFQFTKCDANGNFTFNNVPGGNWRLTIGDQWNDQIIDGLSTAANVGCTPNGVPNGSTNTTTCPGGQTLDLGHLGVQQWQSNLYTKVCVDDNKNGICDPGEIGIPLVYTMIHYRDGHNANALTTDFNGVAPFNETFPLFNWYVVEADDTRYKTTGIHTVYDAGGPADGTTTCGPGNGARQCGTSTAYHNMSNTYESVPLPSDLSVPGAVYCKTADCSAEAASFAAGTAILSSGTASSSSTGRIDPPWVWAEGWAGLTGHSNWIEIGKTPYAACPPACATVTTPAPAGTSSSVGSIAVPQGGTNYTTTPTVTISGGSGSGATATAVVTSGVIASIMVTNPGSGYLYTPTVTISDSSGSGAVATATLTATTTKQVAENGGIHGTVNYAATRPFDDASQMIQQPWQPYVPNVTVNLYQEGFASDGVTPTLTMVDTTTTSSWDAWAQGFYPGSSAGSGSGAGQKPYMSCPGQDVAANDLFYFTLFDQPNYLDYYASIHSGGTVPIHPLPYNSQFKCYDAMKINNQIQPAPYDGKYFFPSSTGIDPKTGKSLGTKCTICVPNPDSTDPYRFKTPMLPPGKYVVEVVMPPGFEVEKEEDKNLLIGDNFIAPVTQQFGGLGTDIFILPDQASVASLYEPGSQGYNGSNYQNSTTNEGLGNEMALPGFPGYTDPTWPCVGEMRVVPDFLSLFPQNQETAPFAGATRPLCDRKEVTLPSQASANARFFIFTSTHIAGKFTGVITDDFTSEFDPFSPQFGEKFSPPNMPISTKDYLGNEISRVYSDHWGIYDGLTYSSWDVNPPNITGYSPAMMTQCMNDPGPILDTNPNSTTYGQMITDPLYNSAYSDFCYINPYMPGLTTYNDTPVVPTQSFVGAGYNNPDCSYPDATPAIKEVDGDGVGPWLAGLTQGAIFAVTLTNAGSAYTSAPSVSFTGAGGSGATATAVISGPVASVNVTNHGEYQYGTTPTISFSGGGGTGATATATMSSGNVFSTAQVHPGSGYTSAPTATFALPPCTINGTTCIQATGTAVRSTTGTITAVNVNIRGAGYTSAPGITFSGGGGGSGASFSSNLGWTVASAQVTAGGSGYSSAPTVAFSAAGTGGTTAAGTAIENGTVVAINLTNGGTNYPSTVTVNITGGGGTGATATASIENGGSITITALGNQQVNNNAYAGPSANVAPFNEKTIPRHYGFGSRCTSPTAGSATCNTASSVALMGQNPAVGGTATVSLNITSWSDTSIVATLPNAITSNPHFPCPRQQQTQYGGKTAYCGQLFITAGNGKQSIDTVTVTVGGKTPTHVSASQTIQGAIDTAAPGDLIIIDPTCKTTSAPPTVATCSAAALDAGTPTQTATQGSHVEAVLMWKPVRLQGVGAASSVIDANAFPSGKLLEPWRRHINCLFGLTLNGVPLGSPIPVPGSNPPQTTPAPYDPNYNGTPGSGYTCPDAGWNYFGNDLTGLGGGTPDPNVPQIDRIALEGIVGWDATLNGNLAEQLQEPSLMGAYEGAGITVLGKGIWTPAGVSPFGIEGALPASALLLQDIPAALDSTGAVIPAERSYCFTSGSTTTELKPNPYPSNFMCNPSSIDGLTIRDSSQGGGGIFVHAWNHYLQIANDRIYNNAGTLSGGVTLGQGEFPDPITVSAPGEEASLGVLPSCVVPGNSPVGTHLPNCLDLHVNIHNNAITGNSSLGDELFSGTLAGGGGASFCTGADYYMFDYNWVCGNVSSAEGGGITHLGFSYNGDIEHNTITFNESSNPTVPTNGGGIMVMGAPDPDPVCTLIPDADCPVGLSDGTGPGLVINGNLIQGNAADSGAGGGIRLQNVNGSEVSSFPTTPNNWNKVSITNNIIVNNVAGWDGAGISLQDALNVSIVNNTISSNDTLATSGVLTQSIGTPVASAPAGSCVQNGPTGLTTASCPQPSGVSSTPNSSVLTTTFVAPANNLTCPNETGTHHCMAFSNPALQNNVIWHNRAFFIGVGNPNPGLTNQQNQVTLYNAFSPNIAPAQTAFGQCGTGSYWDVGVRGDMTVSGHESGFTLSPTWSILDDPGYTGANNLTSNPAFVNQYCNGSRVPPTCTAASGCSGPYGFGTPPGIVDASAPNPVFTMTPSATVDEGNNWINVGWGPLALSDDSLTGGASGNYGGGALFANYALNAGSPAIDRVPNAQPHPTTDFFGNSRPETTGANFDVGAVEFQKTNGTAAILSVTPTSLSFGNQADGTTSTAQTLTLQNTGTANATGIIVAFTGPFSRATVAQGGAGTCTATLAATSTCTINVVFSPTAPPAPASGTATITASVAVSGSPVGLSGTGTTPGAVPTLTSISPNSGLKGNSVNVTLTGTNLTGANGILFSGTSITSTTPVVVSSTQVTATFTIAPTTTTGAQTVRINTPNGTSGTVTFTVQVPSIPTLSTISPNFGSVGSTVSVTLTGTNFTTSGTTVNIAGGVTVGTVWVDSATQLRTTFTIPLTAGPGNVNVTVTTPGGTSAPAVPFTIKRATVSISAPVPALNTGGTGTKNATITVSNTATGANAGPLTLTANPALGTQGGGGNGVFTITGGTCVNGFVINSGGSCTILVQYSGETNTTSANDTVVITDTGAATTTQTSASFSAN